MAPSIVIQKILSRNRLRPQAIGILKNSDFLRLKREVSHPPFPDQYNDWLDEREGLQVGLSAAGVKTVLVTLDLDRFLVWCRTEAVMIGNDALDRFASTTLEGAAIGSAFASIGLGRLQPVPEFPTERLN